MRKIKLWNTFLIVLMFGLFVILYSLFINSPYFLALNAWVSTNKPLFLIYLLLWKMIATIWPPLVGGLVTLAAVPLVGWKAAYLIDFTGSISAGIIDYHLGKKYGKKVLNLIVDKKVVDKIMKIKVKKGKEIETVFLYRIFLGSTILEGIYYGAGVIGVTFKNFLIGAILSHIVVGVPIYYFFENIFDAKNILISIVSLVLGIFIFIKFKKRHFNF